MSLRFRINALVTALVLVFVTATAILMVQDIRRQIREEMEAAGRVTGQLLTTVVYSTQFIPTSASQSDVVLGFLNTLGRVRAQDIRMYSGEGQLLYTSPPSRYKEGRSAPAWFDQLVAPDLKRMRIRANGFDLVVTPDASRAVLDAWDDVLQLAWLAVVFFVATNLLVYWIIGRAFRPVGTLATALRRLEQGDLGARVEGIQTPELRALGDSFNRMAEALDESVRENRQLALAMRQASDAMLLIDLNGRVGYWNPAAERLFGYPVEQMRGLNLHQLAPDHLCHEIDDDLRDLRSGQAVEPHDTVRRTRMGRSLEVSVRASPLIEPSTGAVVGGIVALRDISERRRAETATRELEASRQMAQVVQSHLEEERRALAMELHDELGQYVTAVKTIAQATANRTAETDPQTHASSQAIVSAAGQIYDAMHNIIRRLRPVALERFGLAETLRDAVHEWRSQYPDMRFDLNLKGEATGLGSDQQIALFRVAQESVTNVIKHAGAQRVTISLQVDADAARLKVRDNGTGIPLDRLQGSGRFGLVGMRDRVQALGGSLEVKRPRHGGTEVVASVPVQLQQLVDRPAVPLKED